MLPFSVAGEYYGLALNSEYVVDEDAIWECFSCPKVVRQSNYDTNWYAILCHHNGKLYEVTHYVHSGNPGWFIVCREVTEDPPGTFTLKSVEVVDIKVEADINPQNITQKLSTMLVFS